MSDIFTNAWCDCCGEITAHHVLGQRRLECSDCDTTRESDPNQEFPPGTPAPICPMCNGDGFVRVDVAFPPKEGA